MFEPTGLRDERCSFTRQAAGARRSRPPAPVALGIASAIILLTAPSAMAQLCPNIKPGTGGQVLFADYDGDGVTDVMCHESSGNKTIYYGDEKAPFGFSNQRQWKTTTNFCSHPGAVLFVGDFNGDHRADLLCQDGSGHKWIAYANGAGHFFEGTQDWQSANPFCSHSGAKLFVADFNGDKRTDLLCHDGTGHKWIAYANALGHFFEGTQDWNSATNFCSHPGAVLSVGDANHDGRADLTCVDGTGHRWVEFASRAGRFFDGGGHVEVTGTYDNGTCHQSCDRKAVACLAAAIGVSEAQFLTDFIRFFITGSHPFLDCDKGIMSCESACPPWPPALGPAGHGIGPIVHMK